MNRDRRENRVPEGLSFLMWPALLRAPWLMGSIFETEEDRRRRDEYRKHASGR